MIYVQINVSNLLPSVILQNIEQTNFLYFFQYWERQTSNSYYFIYIYNAFSQSIRTKHLLRFMYMTLFHMKYAISTHEQK